MQACRATLSIPVQASQGHQRPQGLPAGLPHHRSVSQAGQGGCYLPVTQKGGTQPAYLPRLAPDTLLPAAIGEAADEPRVGLGELPDPQADGGGQGGQARPQAADLGLGSWEPGQTRAWAGGRVVWPWPSHVDRSSSEGLETETDPRHQTQQKLKSEGLEPLQRHFNELSWVPPKFTCCSPIPLRMWPYLLEGL